MANGDVGRAISDQARAANPQPGARNPGWRGVGQRLTPGRAHFVPFVEPHDRPTATVNVRLLTNRQSVRG
jgi:hypothetical protein